MFCNDLTRRKGEYFLDHFVCTLPRVAYPKQALKERPKWTSDHEGQPADHYQEPVGSLCTILNS